MKLVVGINEWKSPDLKPLNGAVNDADIVTGFLLDDLGVPQNRIINLRGYEATRTNIIGAIESLKTNDEIKKGDPILIYYAGHGGVTPAGQTWKDENGSDCIQVIFPWDYDTNTHKGGELIHPIPDRTIRGMINDLARKKGDNITLIFDSCHSASVDRTCNQNCPSGRLSRDAEVKSEIPCDIDSNLIPPDLPDPRGTTPLLCMDEASHVLLAACGSDQKAWEQNGCGAFTSPLIKAMRSRGVRNITYQNLISDLPELPGQSPHTYGIHKSRVLFNSRASPYQVALIQVELGSDNTWVLKAGASSGVSSGSVWELYATPTVGAVPIGTLCASSPEASQTKLEAKDKGKILSLPSETRRLYAKQIKAGNGQELKVCFSQDAYQMLGRPQSHQKAQFQYINHSARDDADIIVETQRTNDEIKVILSLRQLEDERHDIPIAKQHLKFKRGKVNSSEVDEALVKASRWNYYLSYENPPSLELSISVALVKLGERKPNGFQPEPFPLFNLINQGVAKVHVRPQDEYGILLVNPHDMPLHVCGLFFDSSDFSIMSMGDYARARAQRDPELGPKGRYVIEDTAEGGGAIGFGLRSLSEAEIGFIKVVWSTDSLELSGLGESRYLRRNSPRANWGTLVVKVVQLPSPV